MTGTGDELDLRVGEVVGLVRASYGIEPLAVTRLESELSTVARIDVASGALVAKVMRYSPAELALTRWRVGAMEHLERAGVPTGRVVPDLGGGSVVVAEAGSVTVVLVLAEWLPGVPLLETVPTQELLRGVGRTAALVARGLAGWSAPPVAVTHPWELLRTLGTLDAAMGGVRDAATRSLVDRAADRFRRGVAPRLDALPRQVVHHDLHDSNLLVDTAAGRLTGVLDFGDMVEGPRVAELAVAGAYAARGAADPVAALLTVAEGWGRVLPLTDAEIDVLLDAGIGRLAVNAAVWASREAGARGTYARARSGRSAAALAALLAADRAGVRSGLHARLGGHAEEPA